MWFLYRTITKLDANISTVVNAIVLSKICQGLTGAEKVNRQQPLLRRLGMMIYCPCMSQKRKLTFCELGKMGREISEAPSNIPPTWPHKLHLNDLSVLSKYSPKSLLIPRATPVNLETSHEYRCRVKYVVRIDINIFVG
jgi:hypothetical protein